MPRTSRNEGSFANETIDEYQTALTPESERVCVFKGQWKQGFLKDSRLLYLKEPSSFNNKLNAFEQKMSQLRMISDIFGSSLSASLSAIDQHM